MGRLRASRVIGDRLCFCLPLIIERGHIDEIVDSVAKALDDTLAELGDEFTA